MNKKRVDQWKSKSFVTFLIKKINKLCVLYKFRLVNEVNEPTTFAVVTRHNPLINYREQNDQIH